MFTYKKIRKVWNKLPNIVKLLIQKNPLWAHHKKNICNWLTKRAEHNDVYDKDFFLRNEGMRIYSAQIMAESIVAEFAPSTVLDVGCGSGFLLSCLQSRSIAVEGLDYSDVALDMCRLRGLNVTKFDLEKDIMVDSERFDLVISTEVAEHLPESSSDRYIDLLCSAADNVMFTASTPGPGGIDHVNERPHSYWIEKFRARGFSCDTILSDKLRAGWKEQGVLSWYHENIMIFHKDKAQAKIHGL